MSQSPKKTAAWRLFNVRYIATLPQYHLYTKEYIELYGVPSSGSRAVDRTLASQKVTVRLTAVQMAIFLDEGADITLGDPKDSVKIYDDLVEHLNDLKRVEQNSFDGEFNVPIDDIRKLEKLAEIVYTIARGFKLKEGRAHGTGLFGKLSDLAGSTPITRNKVTEETIKADLPMEHKPITDGIIEGFAKRNSRGW